MAFDFYGIEIILLRIFSKEHEEKRGPVEQVYKSYWYLFPFEFPYRRRSRVIRPIVKNKTSERPL